MISVIIPCYNYGHLIGDSLNSLIQQTFSDFEVIVVNDGSTDRTEEIVSRLADRDNRIKLYSFPNRGLAASRNSGIEFAKGKFIQFLDADDLLEKKKFEIQIKIFQDHPLSDVVYGSVRYFKEDPYNPADRMFTYWGVNKEWMPKFTGNGQSFLSTALKGNFSHLSSALFRKELVDKIGEFDDEISAVADYHYLLRCVIDNAAFYYADLPETYSLVRWHTNNMSKDPNFMREQEIVMRKKLRQFLLHDTDATDTNEHAIKGLSLYINKSWKTVFMSGGKFDSIKKLISDLGLYRIARKIFYASRSNDI